MEKQKIYKDLNDFVLKQRKLLEIEKNSEILDFQKILSQSTYSDLEKLGICVNKLKLKSIKCGLYGRTLLTLAHQNYNSKKNLENENLAKLTRLPENKIQAGDNVGIYKFNTNFNKSIVSGVVFKKNEHKIIVSLDSKAQFSENQTQQEVLSIIEEINEVTYNRYNEVLNSLEGIYSVINHPSIQIVNVLLNGDSPQTINQSLNKKHVIQEPLDFFKKDLNDEQKQSIQFCLGNQTIGMIHGPPGTGKTMTICELIYQAVKNGMRVLACAPSNIAVDNIVERLNKSKINVCRIGHPARMLPQICNNCLDNKVHQSEGYKFIKELKQNINKTLRKLQKDNDYETKKELKALIYKLRKEMKEIEKSSIKEVIQDSQVICCTNAGAGDKVFKKNFCNIVFDIVVIDECAQALEVSCWLPILKGRRVFLAGDHKQLPPTIKSKQAQGLSLTLFDRLLQDYDEKEISRLLKVQYRMNTKIMEWSSQAVYQGQLKAHESVANHTISDFTSNQQIQSTDYDKQVEQDQNTVLLFIDTANSNMGESLDDQLDDKTKSKKNVGEADLVKIVYKELILQGLKEEDIGVITPYNAQVDEIKRLFDEENNNTQKVEISTVDGFQGREKECIIISMVRSNPLKQVGFLKDYRRMNVAVTRAKRFVALIGDSETVSSDKFLKELIDYFNQHGEIRYSSEYMNDKDVRFGQGFISIDKGNNEQQQNQSEQQKINKQKQRKDKQKNKLESEKQNNQEIYQKDILEMQNKQNQPLIQQQTCENMQLNNNYEEEKKDLNDKEEYDQLLIKYQQMIEEFINNTDQQELVFDSINALNRKVLHDIADQKKLEHSSKGNSKLKKLVIKKKQPANQTEKQTEDNKKNIQKQDFQKQKQLKKSSQDQKLQKQKEQDEMDEDEFLDQQIKLNKYCCFQDSEGHKCQTFVELIGVNCKYCSSRFCMKHNLPEDHGCGNAAKVDAREKFKVQQYALINHEKNPSSQDQIFFQKKLQAKIQKEQEKRKPKKKENKNEKK